MHIKIDGVRVKVEADDINILDVAGRANIRIPDTCHRINKSHGCCQGCVVEINGEQKYACSTKPMEGMNVIVVRDDLKAIRKERLRQYREKREHQTQSGPCCSEASGCCG